MCQWLRQFFDPQRQESFDFRDDRDFNEVEHLAPGRRPRGASVNLLSGMNSQSSESEEGPWKIDRDAA